MDCLDEWGEYTNKRGKNWLLKIGEDLLEANPVQRGIMMNQFIKLLLEERIVENVLAGWVLVAEVYANAMALKELKKVTHMINMKGV